MRRTPSTIRPLTSVPTTRSRRATTTATTPRRIPSSDSARAVRRVGLRQLVRLRLVAERVDRRRRLLALRDGRPLGADRVRLDLGLGLELGLGAFSLRPLDHARRPLELGSGIDVGSGLGLLAVGRRLRRMVAASAARRAPRRRLPAPDRRGGSLRRPASARRAQPSSRRGTCRGCSRGRPSCRTIGCSRAAIGQFTSTQARPAASPPGPFRSRRVAPGALPRVAVYPHPGLSLSARPWTRDARGAWRRSDAGLARGHSGRRAAAHDRARARLRVEPDRARGGPRANGQLVAAAGAGVRERRRLRPSVQQRMVCADAAPILRRTGCVRRTELRTARQTAYRAPMNDVPRSRTGARVPCAGAVLQPSSPFVCAPPPAVASATSARRPAVAAISAHRAAATSAASAAAGVAADGG